MINISKCEDGFSYVEITNDSKRLICELIINQNNLLLTLTKNFSSIYVYF